jgi:hypothetical protein
MAIKFGYIDDFAVRLTLGEAWWFTRGEWRPLDTSEASAKARLVSETEFKKMFPQLPALPTAAFQFADKLS